MYCELPFDQYENIADGDFAIATYLVTSVPADTALKSAGKFAIGQTVGTWIALPGVTQFMIENYQARVLSLYPVPSGVGESHCVMSVAFPMHNFCESFAMMQTAMIGNDVSTAMPIKLLDITFTKKALSHYRGPRHSIEGIRNICGIYDRPLVLNMIKPCIGHTPKQSAQLFFESGMGGVDLIKDDEVLSDTPASTVRSRAIAYSKEADRIFEETGKRPHYVPNVTGTPSRTFENTQAIIDAGCRFCMINFVTTGLDLLFEVSERFGDQLVILGHYAGFGMISTERLGYSNSVMLGTLPRLAGADMVMTMFPPKENGMEHLSYLQTIQKQQLSLGGIPTVMTTVGGGITPLNIGDIVREIGTDVVLGVGGAIQGHPMGTRAGAQAVMAALNCCVKDQSLWEAAADCTPLQEAIRAWGK